MGTRRGTVVGLVLALAVAAPAAAAAAGIPAPVRTELLVQARRSALAAGDAHPYDIRVVLTTRIKAIRLEPGTTAPTCEATAACANGPWYVVAMRGHFHYHGPHPRAERTQPLSVLLLEAEARQPLPSWSVFGYVDRYPKLRAAGTPVRLDSPPRTTPGP